MTALPKLQNELKAGQICTETLDYLLHRRSVSAKNIDAPAPSQTEQKTILEAASRVPDHGKMFPWYFITFEGAQRNAAGELIKEAYLKEENAEAAPSKLALESERFLRAPLVIAVVSRIRDGKHPQWEQILSSGAACQNLCLAANALGYATNWLTEWYSYSAHFKKSLGLDERDNIAGFIYIGTATAMPIERDRPDLRKIVTSWSPKTVLNKGEDYSRPSLGTAQHGFTLPAETHKKEQATEN